jgi:hypothetical protein
MVDSHGSLAFPGETVTLSTIQRTSPQHVPAIEMSPFAINVVGSHGFSSFEITASQHQSIKATSGVGRWLHLISWRKVAAVLAPAVCVTGFPFSSPVAPKFHPNPCHYYMKGNRSS